MIDKRVGIIGGSGVDFSKDIKEAQWVNLDCVYGKPSDLLLYGLLNDVPIAFLPRHARGHIIPPDQINYKANIEALFKSNVTTVISISAVGSLNDNFLPGDIVMIDQYIDNTVNKNISFYDKNLVGHASLADPICKTLFSQIKNYSNQLKHEIKFGGNYVGISGPSFSTRAESRMYKQLGGDLIGMTVPPEAKLAREVGLCYIGFALVTDFDSWDDSKPPVDVTTVEKNLLKMNNKMKKLLTDLISIFQLHEETENNVSFQNNIVTDPKYRKNLKFNF